MNLQEFAALKVGDRIENHSNGSAGEVTATTDGGVKVRWGVAPMDFTYTVQGTAWFHWSKAEPGPKCHCAEPHPLPAWHCPVHGEVTVPMD